MHGQLVNSRDIVVEEDFDTKKTTEYPAVKARRERFRMERQNWTEVSVMQLFPTGDTRGRDGE